jgi:hypothetical protein
MQRFDPTNNDFKPTTNRLPLESFCSSGLRSTVGLQMASSLAKLWRFPILYPRDGSSDFPVDEKKVLADQDTRYHVTIFLT